MSSFNANKVSKHFPKKRKFKFKVDGAMHLWADRVVLIASFTTNPLNSVATLLLLMRLLQFMDRVNGPVVDGVISNRIIRVQIL